MTCSCSRLHFEPNYEDYYLQEKLSDVILLVLAEDSTGHKRKRDDAEAETMALDAAPSSSLRFPGHSMVLLAFSNYCKAKVSF
jgi:hypothetical protein